MAETAPSQDQIADFLASVHGEPVQGLEPLTGGFWSTAYGYRAAGRDLVFRLGSIPEGFEADRDAARYASTDLPVPTVLDVGTAFGLGYAVSVRAYGEFLEDLPVARASAGAQALRRLLRALRNADTPEPTHQWHDWLRYTVTDDPASRTAGWRATLAADPALDQLFRRATARIEQLLPLCLPRRDLIHGDLLHRNVLITPDSSQVTAVFSWKCSVIGDFLYDTAWCTFWSPWHPMAPGDRGDRPVGNHPRGCAGPGPAQRR